MSLGKFPLPATDLPGAVQIALGATLGLLVLASLVCFSLRRAKPDKDWTELTARINTWWCLCIGFTLAVAFNTTVSLVVLAFVCFMAFKEFLSCLPTRRSDHGVLVAAYLTIPLQFYWIYIAWYGMYIIFIPVYAFLFLTMRMALTGETRGFLASAGALQWGLMTTVFCLSHLGYLLLLPNDSDLSYAGVSLLFFIVFTTQTNDICQYLWGKALGAHKVTPLVSPNKTWEGLIGGVLSSVAIACLIGPYLTPLRGWHVPAVGLLIGCAGFLGDIVMSAVKRDLGIKDYGTVLPGHGGVLDRVDSLIFTAPLFFHYLRYFYY